MSYQPDGVLGAQQLHHEVQVLFLLSRGPPGWLGRGGLGRGGLLRRKQPCGPFDHDEALPGGQEGPEHPGHPRSAPPGAHPRVSEPLSPPLELATSGSIFLLQIGSQVLAEMRPQGMDKARGSHKRPLSTDTPAQ